MAAIQPSEIDRDHRSQNSDAQWPELVARAVDDLSRIVHAEIRLAELGIKSLVEQEIDRSIKIVIALSLLLCATVCALGTVLLGFHALVGLWWAAFAMTATISGIAAMIFFLWARRRPESAPFS
jgi:hypothetical protein